MWQRRALASRPGVEARELVARDAQGELKAGGAQPCLNRERHVARTQDLLEAELLAQGDRRALAAPGPRAGRSRARDAACRQRFEQ